MKTKQPFKIKIDILKPIYLFLNIPGGNKL